MPTTLLLDRSPVGLRAALPAMLALTVQRVVLLGSAAAGPGDLDLVRWDGNWYRMVATVGYVHPPGIGPTGEPSALSDLAFFPLYPFLAKLVAATGCPVEVALLGIAWLATLAAGWGIFAVGRAVAGARAATLLVVLWGAAPRSLVTVLPYSEPLFTAAVAWCLYFALRRRWVAAALVCAVAGLTRAAVLPLVAALVLHAVLLLAWPAGRGRGSWRGDARGLLAVATAGIAGMGAYVAWVALRTGDLDGYRNVQRTWGTTAGMPWASVRTYLTERAGGMGGFLYGDYIAIVVSSTRCCWCGCWPVAIIRSSPASPGPPGCGLWPPRASSTPRRVSSCRPSRPGCPWRPGSRPAPPGRRPSPWSASAPYPW